ncbi:MAG: NAD(P)/FAD-dependent oxidoreductase [Novosphingobium sp.]|uniref:flavin-containing monooxygenase n=1 Tax=Novosphingobium sp. TaxID=1874826 RepID=UPI0027372B2B|nr:NAD(P)/FAD-dependent oxidoreductase [Novosphingobium sp.]MDP3550759.1 NAD(P)/FAD-dependent oxidoreductase [Novosphingobium sp.]
MSELEAGGLVGSQKGRPDDARIRAAIAVADPNLLRLTLHQLTGNPRLAEMQVAGTPLWAGALFTYTLAPEYHDEVRELAFEYLTRNWGTVDEDAFKSPASVRPTMELFGHGPLSEPEFLMGYEEAAFDAFPREVRWTEKPAPEVLDRYHVIIVGAGLSGLCAAIHLEQLGMRYTIIERRSGLGGTWHFNNYPEARVDSTSLIYQYKFEKKYPWSEFFASAGETLKYLEYCAHKYNVADKIVFNTTVEKGAWDEVSGKWQLTLRGSDDALRTMDGAFVISAGGMFSTPKLPDIAGIDTFAGDVIFSTNWNSDIVLAGKRIAQIGTGASGVQFMPYLARTAKSVTVFQRSANYVLPMEGYRESFPADLQWMFENYPLYWHWHSYGMHFLNAQLELLQEQDPEWQSRGGVVNERNDSLRDTALGYINEVLADRPDLIEKVTPKFPPMARRPTVDNGWYAALKADHVTLVTDPIDHATPAGLVSADGTLHEADVLVCATGFSTTRYLWPAHYTGRDGATFDELWEADGPRAYLGLTAPGFPNFFMFFGPNSQGRSGSFYSMAESWTRFTLKMIVRTIEQNGRAVEVRREAFDAFNREVDAKTSELVWEKFGQGFYYLTAQGRSFINTPWRGAEIFARLRDPIFDDFEIR